MEHLSDCSVLEVGEYVAVPYAGKLFAAFGATVTKIEPPDGDVARHVGPFHEDEPDADGSQFFGYLNTDKRSVTVPPGDDSSADVVREIIEADDVDVVVEDDLASYGIDPADLAAEHEDLTVVSISGFGLTGPFREYDGPEIVSWAESGQMNKMGYPDSPPTRPRIQAASYWAGQVAAGGGMTALFDQAANGAAGQHVDVSIREVCTSSLERYITGYTWSGDATNRTGAGYPVHGDREAGRTIYETKDGYVSVSIGTRWENFCEEFLERPELIEDERFGTVADRRDNRDAMMEIVEGYIEKQEKWDLLERFQEHGYPSAITSTPKDIAEFEHLDIREFWEEVELPNGESVTMPGFPNIVDEERPAQGRAPRLGEHTAEVYDGIGFEYLPSSGTVRGDGLDDGEPSGAGRSHSGPVDDESLPLEGIKVLDFSWVYAGPHLSRILAALGADVVKIESENKPDVIRRGSGFQFDVGPTADTSAYYNEMNQGKRSMNLNLNTERGREIALEMMEVADIVMENYSPTFMERIGLDYETISDVNPEIVYLSMPGWGKSGPAKGYRSYGLNIQSMAGLDHISGFPDDPPTTSGMSWPDPVNAYFGMFSLLSALYHRERTGEGTYIQSPLIEVAISQVHKPLAEYMNNGRMPERMGNRDEDRRFVQGAYPCAGEDRWAAVAIETDDQWERLCAAMDRPDLVDDPRFESQRARLEHHDAVDDAISEWTRTRSREEVRSVLQSRDVPAGMVSDEEDLVEYDPQLRVREYFAEHDHPEVGERKYQGFPYQTSRYEVQFPSRSPLFGEHTDEVLEEWLGMVEEEINAAESADALF